MPNAKLPERASLEYLKKLAKDRLQDLRRADPGAKLADALLEVARDYGFPSWRALKAEIEKRRAPKLASFFRASAAGAFLRIKLLLIQRQFTNRIPGALRCLFASGRDISFRNHRRKRYRTCT